MTRDELHRAMRKSLLMGDTPEDRHGVYPKRRPIVKYEKPESITDLDSAATSDFPGCVE